MPWVQLVTCTYLDVIQHQDLKPSSFVSYSNLANGQVPVETKEDKKCSTWKELNLLQYYL